MPTGPRVPSHSRFEGKSGCLVSNPATSWLCDCPGHSASLSLRFSPGSTKNSSILPPPTAGGSAWRARGSRHPWGSEFLLHVSLAPRLIPSLGETEAQRGCKAPPRFPASKLEGPRFGPSSAVRPWEEEVSQGGPLLAPPPPHLGLPATVTALDTTVSGASKWQHTGHQEVPCAPQSTAICLHPTYGGSHTQGPPHGRTPSWLFRPPPSPPPTHCS